MTVKAMSCHTMPCLEVSILLFHNTAPLAPALTFFSLVLFDVAYDLERLIQISCSWLGSQVSFILNTLTSYEFHTAKRSFFEQS